MTHKEFVEAQREGGVGEIPQDLPEGGTVDSAKLSVQLGILKHITLLAIHISKFWVCLILFYFCKFELFFLYLEKLENNQSKFELKNLLNDSNEIFYYVIKNLSNKIY